MPELVVPDRWAAARPSGLDVLGAIPWGTHVCQFYATAQDLIETLAPYFREGLAGNEWCLWVTSAPLEVEQATAALRAAVPGLDDYLASGQMQIIDHSQCYTKTGGFDAGSVLEGWTDKLAEALRRGFEGMRVSGDTSWLAPADWEAFAGYEATFKAVIGGWPVLALCTYPLEKCGLHEVLEVVANHRFALIKRAGRWEVIEVAGDIAERKRAEDALRRSEDQLRLITNAAPALIAYVDDSFRFRRANRTYERWLGVPAEQVVGRHVSEVLGEAAWEQVRPYMERALGGEAVSFELELHYRSGPRWVRGAYTPDRDENGRVLGFVVLVHDIAESKRAEERIRRQNAVLEGISRIFRDALSCQTEEELGGCCLAVAQQVTQSECGFLGVVNAKGQLEAVAGSGFCGQEFRGIGQSALLEGKSCFTNHPASDTESAAAPDAPPRSGAFLCVPLMHAGKGLGIVGLSKSKGGYQPQDLEAAEALAPAIVQVWVRAQAERALRAGEERFRQAQKMESIGLLAGGVAHDFNNLLATIMGNASLLETEVSEKGREKVAALLRATEKAADLTRQLLAYAGKGCFLVERLDLSGTVREMAELLRASLSKEVKLKLALKSRLPGIEADRGQLQQAVMNLVINAAEAIGANRSGRVRISTREQEISESSGICDEITGSSPAPGKYVCLEVADTGGGMDQVTRGRIFEPFFTTKFMGRGLGLAAVAGIVRAHQGAVQLETTPGGGATFRLFFPASAPPERRRRRQRKADLRGCETVLLVEDEPLVREFARTALERYGYQVLVARNGREAIQAIRKDAARIGLVLLDLLTPVMGGEEVIGALRSRRPDAKAIVMTGYSESEAQKMFAGKGVSGFLQKPFTAARLAEQVKAVLTTPSERKAQPGSLP